MKIIKYPSEGVSPENVLFAVEKETPQGLERVKLSLSAIAGQLADIEHQSQWIVEKKKELEFIKKEMQKQLK